MSVLRLSFPWQDNANGESVYFCGARDISLTAAQVCFCVEQFMRVRPMIYIADATIDAVRSESERDSVTRSCQRRDDLGLKSCSAENRVETEKYVR